MRLAPTPIHTDIPHIHYTISAAHFPVIEYLNVYSPYFPPLPDIRIIVKSSERFSLSPLHTIRFHTYSLYTESAHYSPISHIFVVRLLLLHELLLLLIGQLLLRWLLWLLLLLLSGGRDCRGPEVPRQSRAVAQHLHIHG